LRMEKVGLFKFVKSPLGKNIYKAEVCTSSMDLAWKLHEAMAFPEWSSVVVDRQINGRGRFGRAWVSPPGNLYASLRLPFKSSESLFLTSFIIAFAIHKVLIDLGLNAEFKWPNDILVCRKKVGGVLIEEKAGVSIAGIGINVSEAPVLDAVKDMRTFPATRLKDFGVCITPLDLWSTIISAIKNYTDIFSEKINCKKLLRTIENHMAFLDEKVVFKSNNGEEFPAIISGLSSTGGIRLKTADGEKILHSGSFFPVVY